MQRQTPWIVLALLACSGSACESRPEPSSLEGRTSAIINGTDEAGTPAVGALVAQGGFGRQSFCTGTLIRPDWVLTAAHCVAEADLRSTGFFIGQNASGQGQAFAAASFHVHPRYALNPAAVLYDIALMKLSSSVPSSVATPIAYNVEPLEAEVGKSVTYIGYGVSDGLNQSGGGRKRRTSIPLDRVDPLTCSSKFEGTGVCFGDSGGPGLLAVSGGDTRVISVNSTVNGCEGDDCDPCQGTGSNYTRVDVFADWIASTMGESFEHCTEQVSLCDCPAACQADGVCDNAVCPADSCKSALDCVLDQCDVGADGSCSQACVQPASSGAMERLGALFECAAERCLEAETAEENRSCFAANCASQNAACLQPAGTGSCAQAASCVSACAGDAACETECGKVVTVDAQAALAGLLACARASCAGQTGDALTSCLGSACPAAYDTCFPPDHCTPGNAEACPVGHVCADTPTGETTCTERPDVPEPDAGQDPGPPPGVGDGDGDGASGDGEADGGTSTTVDPISGGQPPRSSDGGGCQVSSRPHGERPSMLWLALLLGAGALVRRRARAR